MFLYHLRLILPADFIRLSLFFISCAFNNICHLWSHQQVLLLNLYTDSFICAAGSPVDHLIAFYYFTSLLFEGFSNKREDILFASWIWLVAGIKALVKLEYCKQNIHNHTRNFPSKAVVYYLRVTMPAGYFVTLCR